MESARRMSIGGARRGHVNMLVGAKEFGQAPVVDTTTRLSLLVQRSMHARKLASSPFAKNSERAAAAVGRGLIERDNARLLGRTMRGRHGCWSTGV